MRYYSIRQATGLDVAGSVDAKVATFDKFTRMKGEKRRARTIRSSSIARVRRISIYMSETKELAFTGYITRPDETYKLSPINPTIR